MFKVKCSCNCYRADFDSLAFAKTAANMHIMLGSGHRVTIHDNDGKHVATIINDSKSKEMSEDAFLKDKWGM